MSAGICCGTKARWHDNYTVFMYAYCIYMYVIGFMKTGTFAFWKLKYMYLQCYGRMCS